MEIVAGKEAQAQCSSSDPTLFPLLYVTGLGWQGGGFSSQLAIQRHFDDITVIRKVAIGVKHFEVA